MLCFAPCSPVLSGTLLQHQHTPLHPLPHRHLPGGVWPELLRRLSRKHNHRLRRLHQHHAVQECVCHRADPEHPEETRCLTRLRVAQQIGSAGGSWEISPGSSSRPTTQATTRPTWSAPGPSTRRPNAGSSSSFRKSSYPLRTSAETT